MREAVLAKGTANHTNQGIAEPVLLESVIAWATFFELIGSEADECILRYLAGIKGLQFRWVRPFHQSATSSLRLDAQHTRFSSISLLAVDQSRPVPGWILAVLMVVRRLSSANCTLLLTTIKREL